MVNGQSGGVAQRGRHGERGVGWLESREGLRRGGNGERMCGGNGIEDEGIRGGKAHQNQVLSPELGTIHEE